MQVRSHAQRRGWEGREENEQQARIGPLEEETMERSLLAAVSGIDANQTWLDTIANNIANVNTTGFKQSSVYFEDLLSQQIAGATAPTVTQAGINSVAVGTGTLVGAINTNFAEGTLQQTGNPNDVAIQGNGFIVANQNGAVTYTRDGHLLLDANGNLSTAEGGLVQGWQAVNGVVNTNATTTNLTVPVGSQVPAQQTQNMNLTGNLNPNDPTGTAVTMTMTAYDQLGDPIPITLTFTKTATPDQWTMQGTAVTSKNFSNTTKNLFAAAQTVVFNPNGTLASVNGVAATANTPLVDPTQLAAADGFPNALNIDFPGTAQPGSLTQFASPDSAQFASQDGFAPGTLAGYSISSTGVITGQYTNGMTQAIGQIALGVFGNPTGLTNVGNNMFAATPNSGAALVGTAGTGGRGTLVGGAVESSNVDLGRQLTDMVMAQTAYQANTKVVSTSALVLQSLVNMA